MKRCLFKDVQTRQRVGRILQGSGKRRTRTGGIVEHLQYSLKRLNVPLDVEGGRMALMIDGKNLEVCTAESSAWRHTARGTAKNCVGE